MFQCDRCGLSCKTTNFLNKHQKTAQCYKYKDVLFSCRKCKFNTIGIKNIESHVCICINAIEQTTEDRIRLLEIRNSQLENLIKEKDMYIIDLQLRLKYDEMKLSIYGNVIQTQANIKLSDIVKENTEEVHVYNFKNGNVPVIVHDYVNNETEKYVLEPPIKPKKKKYKKHDDDMLIIEDNEDVEEVKKTYRTVKKYIETSEKELGTKLEQDVARIDKEIDRIVYDNFDVSHKEIVDLIEKLFGQIESTNKYTVNLSSIKNTRKKLLGKLNLHEYTDLLYAHNKRLETIFEGRNYNKKKINQIISGSLTALDMRFIYFDGYTNETIENDEVHKFRLALDIFVEHKKQFVPFNKNIFNNIKNYGLALFELSECIEKTIVNRYGFFNIIYVPRKTSKSDAYSFYTLNAGKPKRCWKMECRLEDFTSDFIDHVLHYCITLFRKIYQDVFNDNIYRADYMYKSQITEFDCEQLIQNIILLGQPVKLCKILQHIVMSQCQFTATEADKFDLTADDKLQQKRFTKAVDSEEDLYKIIKQLFDGINDDDISSLLSTR